MWPVSLFFLKCVYIYIYIVLNDPPTVDMLLDQVTKSNQTRLLVPARVPSITQIEQFNHLPSIIITYLKLYTCMEIIYIK